MIEYVDLEHGEELDAFVLMQEHCQFMQTTHWGRFKSDWDWFGLICRGENREIRGTMALLRHKLKVPGTCMLYAPCGPIFEPSDEATFRELVDGARSLGKKMGAYVLRIDPRFPEDNTVFPPIAQKLGFTCDQAEDYSLFQPRMVYISDLNGVAPENVGGLFQRSTRNNLHKAQRLLEEGVLSIRQGDVEDMPRFQELMQLVGKKNGFDPREFDYYRDVVAKLKPYSKLTMICSEGKPIACAICVMMGDTMNYFYSCSDTAAYYVVQSDAGETRVKKFPNELLIHTLLCEVLKNGGRYFDFRGVEGRPVPENPKIGLHNFKKGFGAEFKAYLGQFDLTLRPIMSRVVKTYYGWVNRRRSH